MSVYPRLPMNPHDVLDCQQAGGVGDATNAFFHVDQRCKTENVKNTQAKSTQTAMTEKVKNMQAKSTDNHD